MAELDACHSECRNFSNERFRLKSALDETNEQLDIVRRENKNLADEIKDFWTSLEMEDVPSTNWTNRDVAWRPRKRSCREL